MNETIRNAEPEVYFDAAPYLAQRTGEEAVDGLEQNEEVPGIIDKVRLFLKRIAATPIQIEYRGFKDSFQLLPQGGEAKVIGYEEADREKKYAKEREDEQARRNRIF